MLVGVVTRLPVEDPHVAAPMYHVWMYANLPSWILQSAGGFIVLDALMLILISMWVEGWFRWRRSHVF